MSATLQIYILGLCHLFLFFVVVSNTTVVLHTKTSLSVYVVVSSTYLQSLVESPNSPSPSNAAPLHVRAASLPLVF